MERKKRFYIFKQIIFIKIMNRNFKNEKGVSLIELLVGVAVTALMMGAMFATYTVVNNSYRQVLDKAAISSSSRDMVSMMVRDIRLAGFQYYHGQNEEGIAPFDDLIYTTGLTSEESIHDSHDPIIVIRNELGYVPYDNSTGSQTSSKHEANHVCCDKIHIVYGDFNKNDEQKYKKYRITYFALPMEYEVDKEEKNKYYGIYKTKESWLENSEFPSGGWTSDTAKCNECFRKQLVRSHVVDMEFLLFDKDGVDLYNTSGTETYPQPDNDSRYDLNKIRQVDIALSFRSGRDFYRSPPANKRFIKTLRMERNKTKDRGYEDKFLRESVVVSVYTRNIGEQ